MLFSGFEHNGLSVLAVTFYFQNCFFQVMFETYCLLKKECLVILVRFILNRYVTSTKNIDQLRSIDLYRETNLRL